MNHRVLVACCAVVFLSLSLAIGQSKDDGAAKCPAGSSASCCPHGTKASLSSASKSSASRIVSVKNEATLASGKECPMKGVKNPSECTAAEKAKCDMSKGDMSKCDMTKMKAGSKADCYAGKAKGAEAKNTVKKSSVKIADAKETD